MSRTIEQRPNRPPTEPPIIMGLLFDSLACSTGTSVEDVGTGPPTVESGKLPKCAPIARLRENESSATTSGTGIDELI